MNLSRYHEQHSGIHSQLADLKRRLEPAAFAADPAQARQSLVTLAARLNIHLAFEDKALYPPLLGNADPAVQSLTRRYMDEMGGLKEALAAHLKRWLTLQKVQDEPGTFQDETRSLLQALERRLAAEDQEFYPALERLA